MTGTRPILSAVLCCLFSLFSVFGQLMAADPMTKKRPDPGLSDPTVNPGQASGMRVVRGEVKQASPKTIIIEDSKGKETTMSIDAATAGDRDVRPGDIITGTITGQGRAVAIHKEAHKETANDR